MTDRPGTTAGFVALVGATNAGKSTLLNRLVGAKVAIVSHKVQTTRALIRGIAIFDETQIVFVDTPGLFAPKRKLDRAMVDAAWSGARDAECILFLVDSRAGVTDTVREAVTALGELPHPKLLVLNKIDLVEPETLLPLTEELNSLCPFEDTFMISATGGEGMDALIKALKDRMKPGPWLYPEDQISDVPMRALAAELTREKLYERLHQELPYVSHVVTEDWKAQGDGSARIEQTIYVERDGHKKIVIGKGGQTIKWISTEARKAIAAAIDAPVHLFLFVKVRPKWASDPERFGEMGLEFPTE